MFVNLLLLVIEPDILLLGLAITIIVLLIVLILVFTTRVRDKNSSTVALPIANTNFHYVDKDALEHRFNQFSPEQIEGIKITTSFTGNVIAPPISGTATVEREVSKKMFSSGLTKFDVIVSYLESIGQLNVIHGADIHDIPQVKAFDEFIKQAETQYPLIKISGATDQRAKLSEKKDVSEQLLMKIRSSPDATCLLVRCPLKVNVPDGQGRFSLDCINVISNTKITILLPEANHLTQTGKPLITMNPDRIIQNWNVFGTATVLDGPEIVISAQAIF